jgi:2-amino-4-hydroxy-6-hydroxymethyldihydropteridine diphosphokinase
MKAVVALGSNLGNCKDNLNTAITNLHLIIDNLIVSPFTQTEPVGGPEQDDFLNAVAVGQCQLSAVDLLSKLLSIEEQMGRTRNIKWGPRVIDLDLIVYGEQTINSDFLKLPHPLAKSREFVLSPWLAIDPEGEIPGAGKIKSLLASLNSQRKLII